MSKRVSFLLVSFLLAISALCSFALDRQPNADYHARREALAKKAGGPVLLFAPLEEGDLLYGFRQDENFFYLSGESEPGMALLIVPASEGASGRPYTEILFLPPHNVRMEKFTGPKLGAENPDAPKITGFDHVEDMSKLPEEVAKALAGGRPVVYTDLPERGDHAATAEPLAFLKRTNAFVLFQDVKQLVAAQRMIKDPREDALIRKAVDASIAAHLAAFRAVKPEVNEGEIAGLLQYEWMKRGCARPAYASIVGSGINSTILHYSDDSATMKSGDVVVIDAAGEYSMYAADITRTLPVNGHFTARQREIYDIVLGAQQAAMDAFKSGKSVLTGDSEDSLFKVAKDYIDAHGKDLHGKPLGQYFIHGLGHYIGLNVHDAGDYKVPLGPGMAFTIEPGIYIPEEKIGVRIEDDYWVDPDGKLVKLSAALPSKADEVEKAMAEK